MRWKKFTYELIVNFFQVVDRHYVAKSSRVYIRETSCKKDIIWPVGKRRALSGMSREGGPERKESVWGLQKAVRRWRVFPGAAGGGPPAGSHFLKSYLIFPTGL